jgi:hypothetical protein
MTKNKWKDFGIICSAVWLVAAGLIAIVCWFFAELAMRNLSPSPEVHWAIEVFGYVLGEDIRSWIFPGYILFGVGPVISFVLLMKKLGHPIEGSRLIALGLWGAFPFVLLLPVLL